VLDETTDTFASRSSNSQRSWAPASHSTNIRTAADRARPGEDAGERQHRDMVASLRRRLAEHIGDDEVERYFDGQTRVSMLEDRLEVTVASGLLAKLLDTRYGTSIRRAAGDAFGNGKPVEVAFRVDRAAFSARPETPAPAPEPQQARVQIAARAQASAAANARCNFENYLVGKSNRLAHAAAVRVADADGYVAPLFLHGSCGMGKTHLLQATVQRYVANHPGSSVRYTTAEAFTNEFVAAIKANRVEAFRRSYRKVDLLAIDDVHFFSSKEATQAELLHTLDAVGLEGARIILASDEHPKEIRKLSDRLSSRFMAGIVVRIEAPDRELRERLVKHLAHRRGMILEDAAIGILVDRTERAIGSLGGFGGSVREIEGLLNQIDAVNRLLPELASQDGVVGALLVRRALGISDDAAANDDASRERRVRRPVAGEVVLSEICKTLGVEVMDVHGKGRHPRVVLARGLVAYLCRTLTTLSFPEIASIIGRDNHSTVITAFKRFERQMAQGESPEAHLPPTLGSLSLRELSELLARQIAKASY
jgi:chromosomal replication initiator protein